MRRCALPLLVLALVGCRSKRFKLPLDEGWNVHLIVSVAQRPAQRLAVRPYLTVGHHATRGIPIYLDAGRGARTKSKGIGREVAILTVPRGRYPVSIWDPGTGLRAEDTVEIDGDRWFVFQIDPAGRRSRLGVYEYDPFDDVGPWRPLTDLPD